MGLSEMRQEVQKALFDGASFEKLQCSTSKSVLELHDGLSHSSQACGAYGEKAQSMFILGVFFIGMFVLDDIFLWFIFYI